MKYLILVMALMSTACSSNHPAVNAAWAEYTSSRSILIVPEEHLMDDWNDHERDATAVVISDNPIKVPEGWN